MEWDRLTGPAWIGMDTATAFLPWYSFLGEQLRAGHIPTWNPHTFAGTPFAADPESGWMYLPAMLAFTLLPLDAAVRANLLVHVLLAALLHVCAGARPGLQRVGCASGRDDLRALGLLRRPQRVLLRLRRRRRVAAADAPGRRAGHPLSRVAPPRTVVGRRWPGHESDPRGVDRPGRLLRGPGTGLVRDLLGFWPVHA